MFEPRREKINTFKENINLLLYVGRRRSKSPQSISSLLLNESFPFSSPSPSYAAIFLSWIQSLRLSFPGSSQASLYKIILQDGGQLEPRDKEEQEKTQEKT